MHQEKYSLTWHTYSDHLKSMMKELMMNEDYSDVTLVTEDKKHIKANICILSACSPVFKDMLKKENKSNPIIYLRGIQYSEMESIMQFIYLGEATFYKERMGEIIAVAKSLEIKQLCNAEPESNDQPHDEPTSCDLDSSTKEVKEENIISDQDKQAPQERRKRFVSVNNKYECEQCHKTFFNHSTLNRHKKSIHEGVKYACNQCDYQATVPNSLTVHIKAKHEGVKYECIECDYQAIHQSTLYEHIQAKHEGVMYDCNHCNYQATKQGNLIRHVNNKHASTKNE